MNLRITPRALLEVKQPVNPHIHPDGHRVAFEMEDVDFVTSRTTNHIWITEWIEPEQVENAASDSSADRNEHQNAVQDDDYAPTPEEVTRRLTSSVEGEWDPQWSPDGHYLAFLSERADPEQSKDSDEEPTVQVWLLLIDGGEPRKLTSTKEGVLAYHWMPDSLSIVYAAELPPSSHVDALARDEAENRKMDAQELPEKRHRRALLKAPVDPSNGGVEMVWPGDCGLQDFEISSAGDTICFTTNVTGEPNDYHRCDLWALRTQEGAPGWSACMVTDRGGDKTDLCWSPDGKAIAFLSWLNPDLSFSRQSLFMIELPAEGSQELQTPRLIDPEFDYDLSDLCWSPHDGRLKALAAVGIADEIVRINGERIEFDSPPNSTCRHGLAIDPGGAASAWIEESLSRLPEVCFRDASGETHQLTRLNAEFADTYTIPKQEVIRWPGSNGVEIEGVLTYPINHSPDAPPVPLLVQLHGGPKGRAKASLSGYYMPAAWSAAGYAVLAPNFRGSEGYGNQFAIAVRRDLGGADYEDVMLGVDRCVELGIADENRLGIMGGSYGGFLVNCAITRTQRFFAAISMFGIFNLQSDFSTSLFPRWNYEHLGAYYWDDPDIYHRLSTASLAGNIHTPTLILHGEEDENTFIGNSRELYQALHTRKVPCLLVHYPREPHGLSEPNHRLDEMRRCLGWMDKYVRYRGLDVPAYRFGDRAANNNASRELVILYAKISPFLGRQEENQEEDAVKTALLEVGITIYATSPQIEAGSLELSLAEILLEYSHAAGPMQVVTPIGVPMEMPGGKLLVEGDNIRLRQSTAAETGRLELALAVVFRVPIKGEGLLRVSEYPPVAIDWSDDAE